jgi:hypothetical protein
VCLWRGAPACASLTRPRLAHARTRAVAAPSPEPGPAPPPTVAPAAAPPAGAGAGGAAPQAPVTPPATKSVVICGTPKAGGHSNKDLAAQLNGAVSGSGVVFNSNNYVAQKKTIVVMVRGAGTAAAAKAAAERGSVGGANTLVAAAQRCKPPAAVVDEDSLCAELLRLRLLTASQEAEVQRVLDASAGGVAAREEERKRINIWEVLRLGPKGQYLVASPHLLSDRWPAIFRAAAEAHTKLSGEPPGERTSARTERTHTVYLRVHAQALSQALEEVPNLLDFV